MDADIKPASAADIPLLMTLAKTSPEASAWQAQHYKLRVGSPDGLVFLACENGEVAGFIVARVIAPECEIENVVVAPSQRRHGIGGALVQAAVESAAAEGCTAVWLEVRKSNAAARRLYASCGFSEVSRRPNYYRAPEEDAVVLRRLL